MQPERLVYDSARRLSTGTAEYYRITGGNNQIKRLIVSHPLTRNLCNDPKIFGQTQYPSHLQRGIRAALNHPDLEHFADRRLEHQTTVYSILRGAENFRIVEALSEAYNFEHFAKSFVSCQRARKDEERGEREEHEMWEAQETGYSKIVPVKNAHLFIGDVVATGLSAKRNIEYLISAYENGVEKGEANTKRSQGSIKHLTFFTIGGPRAEEIVTEVDSYLRDSDKHPNYEGATVVYLEGRFRMVEDQSEYKICLEGTDLVKQGKGALLTPEFLRTQFQYSDRRYLFVPALHRCAIYDCGSRSFDPQEFQEDVLEYFGKLRQLAREGLTLREALEERIGTERYGTLQEFRDAKQQTWEDVPDVMYHTIFNDQKRFWAEVDEHGDSELLERACTAMMKRTGPRIQYS